MADQLGIVYTPVEVVDFIIRSVDDILRKEFGRGLTDNNVHILDPFTGTGTFITRLLQSGLITQEALERKYRDEIHANEIVLLAYYIAAVNIENTYHDILSGREEYQAFNGICLTDTFQLREVQGDFKHPRFFPNNCERVEIQKKAPITVIMSNPPYSATQTSANDDAKNMSYPNLEKRIAETYINETNANNKNKVYDAYIKAFRWSSDRLNQEQGGIICFVSSAGWLDGNSMEGFRKCLEREFNSIYIFHLRGNARTQGEQRRKEKDNVFGSGSRAPIAITLLVKNPNAAGGPATIFYYDIGDYLTREQKLSKIRQLRTVANPEFNWRVLTPNKEGDWINPRNTSFSEFTPIGDKTGKEAEKSYFMPVYSMGLQTARDAWCFNSSKTALLNNISNSIKYYNSQVEAFNVAKSEKNIRVEDFIDFESGNFSWATNN
jgi:predicted helicase